MGGTVGQLGDTFEPHDVEPHWNRLDQVCAPALQSALYLPRNHQVLYPTLLSLCLTTKALFESEVDLDLRG